MVDLYRDLVFVLRTLRRSPVLVVVTAVSLAIGIGATTTVFTIANAFLFRPSAGLGDPSTLVTVYASEADGDQYGPFSYPDYRDLVEAVDALEGAAAFGFDALKVGDGPQSESILAQVVTGNYFQVMGIELALGRPFTAEETQIPGAERVVVISHDLWQSRFEGDPLVLGDTIRFNGHVFTIVGVAPRGLGSRLLALKAEAWVPLGVPGASRRRSVAELEQRKVSNYMVMGRLREGASLAQVEAQLEVLAARLHADHPEAWTDDNGQPRTLSVLSERDSRVRPGALSVLAVVSTFLLVAAGLILLVACSNVASILIARAARRQRELAVRSALGAGRLRLVRLLLVEALVLGGAGGALGVALARLGAHALSSIPVPIGLPLHFDFQADHRVVAFAVALSVAAALVFGLAPALGASRPDLVQALKGALGDGSRRGRRFGLRKLLVVAQVAASVVLVSGATLFMRSLVGAMEMDLGLNPERIAAMTKELPGDNVEPAARVQFVRDLVDRLAPLAGVEDVQVARSVELTMLGVFSAAARQVAAGSAVTEESPEAHGNAVSPGYLEMLEIPVIRGRSLRDTDVAEAPAVAVVNETMAERLWGRPDVLGERFTAHSPLTDRQGGREADRTYEVVGVTRDGKYLDIDDSSVSYYWTSLYQDAFFGPPVVSVLVKGAVGAAAVCPLMSRAVPPEPTELVVSPPTPLVDLLDIQFLHLRAASAVLGWGGAFGLVLAVVGIYGLVSFAATQRNREIAIRLAIGARRTEVVRLVAREGLVLSVVGLAVGLGVLVPLAHTVRSQLFGISPIDPVALGGGGGLLLLVAAAAAAVPAWRACRIAPMQLLREE